jgi:hypothetical protein
MNSVTRHVKFDTGINHKCIYPAPAHRSIIYECGNFSKLSIPEFPKISTDLQTAFAAETRLDGEQWLEEQQNMVKSIIIKIIVITH